LNHIIFLFHKPMRPYLGGGPLILWCSGVINNIELIIF
jgi:hypothetical protein